MEKDKEAILKKLIQKAEPDKIGPAFTDRVMKNIQIEAEHAGARQASLETMLISLAAEKPSPLFQKNIMAQIARTERKVAEPIISKNVWYLIAAAAVVLIGFCLGTQSDVEAQYTPDFLGNTNNILALCASQIMVLPMIYPVAVFALSILLFADYAVRYRLVRQ